jgi:hypothetical protein
MRGSSPIVNTGKPRAEFLPGAVTLLCLVSCLLLPSQVTADNASSHAFVERSGELRVSNGMTLHLNADLGNIRIQALPWTLLPYCATPCTSKRTLRHR